MDGNKRQKSEWAANRLNAYYGSPQHFFRALYQKKAAAEGFILNRIVRMDNPKYPTEEELQILKRYGDSIRQLPNNMLSLQVPMEIADIQRRKAHEKQNLLALTESRMPDEKVMHKDGAHTYFSFKDWLGIVYRKALFTAEKGDVRKTETTTTVSAMVNPGSIVFEIFPDGNYDNPNEMMFMDDWAKQKNAKLLPLDYEPEQ